MADKAPSPVTFMREHLWWAQSSDSHCGLVTASGSTQEEAIANWQREYAHTKHKLETAPRVM